MRRMMSLSRTSTRRRSRPHRRVGSPGIHGRACFFAAGCLVIQLGACASTPSRIPAYPDALAAYDPVRMIAEELPAPESKRQCESSLSDLAASARRAEEPVTMGLSGISGLRWDARAADVLLLGPCATTELNVPLSAFVEALRIAAGSAGAGGSSPTGMSLDPIDQSDPESAVKVAVFPESARSTGFMEALTRADYLAKAVLASNVVHLENVGDMTGEGMSLLRESCEAGTFGSIETGTNSYFAPGSPKYRYETLDDGYVFHVTDLPIILRTGDPMRNPRAAARNLEFTAELPELSSRLRVFADLRSMFQLYHAAQMLLSGEFDYDLAYWLAEYRLEPQPVPEELPGFKPMTSTWACWDDGENKYKPLVMSIVRGGGVVVDYREHIGRLLADVGMGSGASYRGAVDHGDRAVRRFAVGAGQYPASRHRQHRCRSDRAAQVFSIRFRDLRRVRRGGRFSERRHGDARRRGELLRGARSARA